MATQNYFEMEKLKKKPKIDRAEEQFRNKGLKFTQHMIAGSTAGIAEHGAMFPVDTIKTRIQMIGGSSSSVSVASAFKGILRQEGAYGLYRGAGAMVLGAGPSHAVHFAVYEACKLKFALDDDGHHPVVHGAAGAMATVANDAVATPLDVVKQRLQLKNSPYRGLIDCARRIAAEEGLVAFYASYKTTLLMNVPFMAAQFPAYEAGKKALGKFSPQYSSEEHLVTHLVAGGSSGALASAITTPLDVVKTRLQCQGVCGAERFDSSSVKEVTRRIVAHEGVMALFKGMTPRVLFHTPAAAITWSTYEAGKAFLQRLNEGKY